jgi:hypothetical protein
MQDHQATARLDTFVGGLLMQGALAGAYTRLRHTYRHLHQPSALRLQRLELEHRTIKRTHSRQL